MTDTVVAAAERTLPHNLEAERSVLGAILVHNDAFNLAAQVIDAGDFYRDAHRRIFDRMVSLNDRGNAIDFVTLKEELARNGELDEVGGPRTWRRWPTAFRGPPTSSTTRGSSRKNRRCGI
jgi:replicative DNA helicase